MPQINVNDGVNVSVSINRGPLNGGQPGTPANSIQYNANGVFGGLSTVTTDGTNLQLSVNNLKLSGGSSGQLLSTDGTGNLTFVNDNTGGLPANVPFGVQFANTTGNGFQADANFQYTPGNTTLRVPTVSATTSNTTSLNVSGVSQLGAVGNVKITGGSAGQVLTTDGTGNLSFANAGSGGGGTVTSVGGNGSGLGFSLTGTVTSSGNLQLTTPDVTSLRSTLNIGTVANVSLNGNSQTYLNGVGVFEPFTGVTQTLQATLASGNTANISMSLTGGATYNGNGSGLSQLTGANVTGQVGFAAVANSVAVSNVVGLGNIATTNYNGNGQQRLAGNGAWVADITTLPGGSNTQVQFNDGGIFGASPGFTFNKTGNALSVLGNANVANLNATYFVSAQDLLITDGLSNIISIGAPLNFTSYGLTLPPNAGSNGQVLKTDGTGNLSWATDSAQPAGSNTQLQFNSNGVFGASANLTFTDAANVSSPANLQIGNLLLGSRGNITSNGFSISITATGNTGQRVSITGSRSIDNPINPGGSVELFGGSANGNSVFSGGITLESGPATGPTTNGGEVYIAAGSAEGGVAGPVTIAAGSNTAGRLANITLVGNVQLGNVANVHITGGSNGQVLKTDGNGNLSWQTDSATPAGANTQVQFNSNGAFAGSSNLTFTDGTVANLSLNNLTFSGRAGTQQSNITSLGTLNVGVSGSNGGGVQIIGADSANNPARPGGSISLFGGSGSGNTVQGGSVDIEAGVGVDGTVNGGDVYIAAGTAANGNPGSIDLVAGINNSGTRGNITITGNVQLGNIANVHINGGSNGQFLQTNGAGNLVFANVPTQATENLQQTLTAGNTANIGITLTGTATYTGNGVGLSGLAGANVTGQVGFAAVANSVAVANVAGIGNIATTNFNGNGQQRLAGNGAWVADLTTNPAGSNTQIQFNNNGVFGASANLTHDTTTGITSVSNLSGGNVSVTGLLSTSSTANVNFTNSSNVTLGPVGNVRVTGGANGQILTTNGSGVLSWTTPQDIAGWRIKSTTVSFNAASPITSFTLPANTIIDRVSLIVDTPFDGTPTVSVGVSGNVAQFAQLNSSQLAQADRYDFLNQIGPNAASQDVIVTITGGNSAGSLRAITTWGLPE